MQQDSGQATIDRVRAVSLVVRKARAYQPGARYVAVHLYSTNEQEVLLLRRVFGGNYYRKAQGYLWVLGDKERQAELWRLALPALRGDARERLRLLERRFSPATQVQPTAEPVSAAA